MRISRPFKTNACFLTIILTGTLGSIAQAQEFTTIVDSLQCARFSNGSQMLVRDLGGGSYAFTDPGKELAVLKKERRKLKARASLFKQRLRTLSQATKARNRLIATVAVTFSKLFGETTDIKNLGPTQAEEAVQSLIARIDLRLTEITTIESLISGCLQGRNPRLGGGTFLSASVQPIVGVIENRIIGGYVITTNGIGTKFRKKPGAFYGCLMFKDKYGELLVPLKIFDSAGACGGLGELQLPTAQCDALLSGKTTVGTSMPGLEVMTIGAPTAERVNSAYLDLVARQPIVGVVASRESLSTFQHSSFCQKYR